MIFSSPKEMFLFHMSKKSMMLFFENNKISFVVQKKIKEVWAKPLAAIEIIDESIGFYFWVSRF